MPHPFITTVRTIRQLARPVNLRTAWTSWRRSTQVISQPILTDPAHLELAIDWLLAAHAAVDRQGFAANYSLSFGWGQPYPEGTGYLIPTLISYITQSDYRQAEIMQAVRQSGQWLLAVQQTNGAFPGYDNHVKPVAFDTGQAVLGLCALYRYTRDDRYLVAAKKAGDWLVADQEANGAWIKHAYQQRPHVYYSCVSWGLVELSQVSGDLRYQETAVKNLDWVISQQQPNGWFNYFSFSPGDAVLHTIAYTLQGLIESGIILHKEKYITVAQKTADVILDLHYRDGLHSFYNHQWHSVSKSCCLTGVAQMGVVWLKLFQHTQVKKYHTAAGQLFTYLKTKQVLMDRSPHVRGALAGSAPIWGDYLPFIYPSWSVKFFIDLGSLLKLDAKVPGPVTALCEIKLLLERAKINYWLTTGTLLGAVRNNQFIANDTDIDLAILADDADKILALLPQLGERGWRVDVTTFYIFLSRPAERVLIEIAVCRRQGNQVWVPLLKIPPRFNFLLKYADLMAERAIYRNYHQHIPRHHRLAYSLIPRWLDRPLRTWLFRLNDFCGQQHYAMILPSKFIDNLTSVILYDIEFSAPSPPEDYLELIYGPNWRTPDPYWRAKNIYALDHTFFRTSDQAKYTLIK